MLLYLFLLLMNLSVALSTNCYYEFIQNLEELKSADKIKNRQGGGHSSGEKGKGRKEKGEKKDADIFRIIVRESGS